MVEDRLDDGVRIAQLLASELSGEVVADGRLTVTDADPDVEPSVDGTLAYRVRDGRAPDTDGTTGEGAGGTGRAVASVYVHPDRARVEFRAAPDAAAERGDAAGLRVRPKLVAPPRTVVFVEDGAQVKRVLPVFEAVLDAAE